MTNATTVFADSETTSLRPDRRPWNIGLIIRDGLTGTEVDEEIIIADVDLTHADPISLAIGHFRQRHPLVGGDPGRALIVPDEAAAARWLFDRVLPDLRATDDDAERGEAVPVHLVGAVINFDVETFVMMLARHRLYWPGHYHLLDAENIALGALAARGIGVGLPFSGERVSELMGLDLTRYDRHTAGGDARWARDLYDAAMRPITADASGS